MAKKFAFESGEVSVAFRFMHGLGDSVVARKVFDAIIELAPNCRVDIFCMRPNHHAFAEAFYDDSPNLNSIVDDIELYKKFFSRYDLALWVMGTHAVVWDALNGQRLQIDAPKLLSTMERLEEYNQENFFDFKPWSYSAPLRNVAMSRILNKNFHYFLSGGGVLNIREDGAWLKVAPKYQAAFDALKLGQYVTIYSNISRDEARPKAKAWSMRYLVEYVAAVKKIFPALTIVQVGGSDEREIPNVDKNFSGCDLQLTKHILANSLLHVGCEGGLIHLATALGTRCLVFFGVSDWHYFAYAQNINVASEVCSPCLYVAKDFGCLRGESEPPCMADVTPQLAVDETIAYLESL